MRLGSRKQRISSERRKSAAPDTAGAPSSSGISNERPRLTSVFQMKTSVQHLQDTENLQLLGQRLLRTHLPGGPTLPSICHLCVWKGANGTLSPPAGMEWNCNPAVLGTANCSSKEQGWGWGYGKFCRNKHVFS